MPKVVGQDQTVYKRKTCKHCGSINEYTPNEERVLYKGKDISGSTEVQYGFNCAGCGKEVITKEY